MAELTTKVEPLFTLKQEITTIVTSLILPVQTSLEKLTPLTDLVTTMQKDFSDTLIYLQDQGLLPHPTILPLSDPTQPPDDSSLSLDNSVIMTDDNNE